MEAFLSHIPELFGSFLALRVLSKPLRVLARLLLQATVGVGTLLAAFFAGLPIVPSLAAVAVSAILGLPGTLLILGVSALL